MENRKLVFLQGKINMSGVVCDSWPEKRPGSISGSVTGACVKETSEAASYVGG